MKTWLVLKDLSSSRLAYSTSVWIFLVPAVLKISEISSNNWDVTNILVPYSFYLLYFSSVAFFIASSLYMVMCPYFIKKIHSYSFFVKEGMSVLNINSCLCNVGEDASKKLVEKLRLEVGAASVKDIDDGRALTLYSGSRPASFSFNENQLDKVFWIIYDFQQGQMVFFQFLCWVFYSIGFSLIIFLFFMNFLRVFSYVFSG